MRWNKLKIRIEENLHYDVKGRIKFQFTKYTDSHDGASTVLRVIIDGKTVLTAGSLKYRRELSKQMCEMHIEDVDSVYLPSYWDKYRAYAKGAEEELHDRGIFDSGVLYRLMDDYLDLDIKSALNHEEPFIRALALIDRRVGSRTIAKFDIESEWHPLIKLFYDLRIKKNKTI